MALNRKSFLRSMALAGAAAAWPTKSLLAANEQIPTAKRVLRVAHITDIHVTPGKVPEYGMAQALNEINAAKDKADFAIAGGDMIMDAMSTPKDKVIQQWKTFHGIMQGNNSLQVYHTIGNHDVFNIGKSARSYTGGKQWACDEMKITNRYYSFDKGKWRFIILDSIHDRPILGYIGKLDDEQLNWLNKTIADTPDGMYICVTSHIPMLAVCTMFDGGSVKANTWHIGGGNLHEDAKVLKDIFYQSKKVKACLSGHIHLIDELEYCGTKYYCNGAVSGAWWGGNNQEFAPAYAMMNFYDNGTTSRELHYYNWKA